MAKTDFCTFETPLCDGPNGRGGGWGRGENSFEQIISKEALYLHFADCMVISKCYINFWISNCPCWGKNLCLHKWLKIEE